MKVRFFNATARQRIAALADPGSFKEWLPPAERLTSPHLPQMDLPVAFDDGVIIGRCTVHGTALYLAAQEGAFLGGSFGEVHGAKILGVLRRALEDRVAGVLLLLDSGGVRLQEANAGEMAVSEIIRQILACRQAGVRVIALVCGANGAFGGAGIIAACCDTILASEQARLGVSGPEVIEAVAGVEVFDASDRALVWRTVGAKNRYLFGIARQIVQDDADNWRQAVADTVSKTAEWGLELLRTRQQRLEERVARFGDCNDALEIWQRMGFAKPEAIPLMEPEVFVEEAKKVL